MSNTIENTSLNNYNVIALNPSLNYGETTDIIVYYLLNVNITPNNSVINMVQSGYEYIITVKPTQTTLYYVTGDNGLGQIINLNLTVYVNVTILEVNNTVYTDYNTPIDLNAYGSLSYYWYPSTYLNQTRGSVVTTTPLESITYYIEGTDQFNTVTTTYLNIVVNSNLLFTPEKPTLYDGNLLNLNVKYNSIDSNIIYTWKSELFDELPPNCVNLLYGDTIKLHPYNSISYTVTAYENQTKDIITRGKIQIDVIVKPSHIIDVDILPYSIYKYVIHRNRNKLIKVLTQNKTLSKKIIDFYYTTLQTAYRMEYTVKNGISYKVNWLTLYQVMNESNEMILTFNQQWNFYQYISSRNKMFHSNFGYLLNIINEVYLEKVQKIPIYPIEPAVF